MVPENILILVAAATAFAKPAVDMIRAMVGDKLPAWASPPLAVLVAIGALLFLAVARGEVLTQELIAQAILAGFLAGAGAVGVTELQKHSTPQKLPPTVVWATHSAPVLYQGGETKPAEKSEGQDS